jgi:hypothetical protein
MSPPLPEGSGQRERELHAEVLDQEGPLVGGFFDDFAGGFAGAVAGPRFDADQDRGGILRDFAFRLYEVKLSRYTARHAPWVRKHLSPTIDLPICPFLAHPRSGGSRFRALAGKPIHLHR